MKLLLLSNLHLNHQPFSAVGSDGRRWDDGADAVVLAGDIDEGLKGLRPRLSLDRLWLPSNSAAVRHDVVVYDFRCERGDSG